MAFKSYVGIMFNSMFRVNLRGIGKIAIKRLRFQFYYVLGAWASSSNDTGGGVSRLTPQFSVELGNT